MTRLLPFAFALVIGCSTCGDRDEAVGDPGLVEMPLPGEPERPYLVHLPDGYDPEQRYPVLYAFHGGGGNAEVMAATTCTSDFTALGHLPGSGDPSCLHNVAAGYIVVYPNGRVIRETNGRKHRGWEAGGGRVVEGRHYRCTTPAVGDCGRASSEDVGYFIGLHAEVSRAYSVDGSRVYLTGISNGAALSFRLACAVPEVVSGIAAVAGANQFAVNMFEGAQCAASNQPVALLLIHGDADPTWKHDGSPGSLGREHFVSPRETLHGFEGMPGWLSMNGCSSTERSTIPGGEGEAAQVESGVGCRAPVRYVRALGGGHTWPDGWQYLPEALVGETIRDVSANQLIVDFFDALGAPD